MVLTKQLPVWSLCMQNFPPKRGNPDTRNFENLFEGFSIVQLNKFIMSRLPGVGLCSIDRRIRRKKLKKHGLFQKVNKYGLKKAIINILSKSPG